MEQSTRRIYKAAIGSPEDHLVIFLAHNGPTGLSKLFLDLLLCLKSFGSFHLLLLILQ